MKDVTRFMICQQPRPDGPHPLGTVTRTLESGIIRTLHLWELMKRRLISSLTPEEGLGSERAGRIWRSQDRWDSLSWNSTYPALGLTRPSPPSNPVTSRWSRASLITPMSICNICPDLAHTNFSNWDQPDTTWARAILTSPTANFQVHAEVLHSVPKAAIWPQTLTIFQLLTLRQTAVT